jgi:hypothetical protein
MNALAAAQYAAVQMIDTSIVRVHQHGTVPASLAIEGSPWDSREVA